MANETKFQKKDDLVWEATEHVDSDRSMGWYLAFGLITSAMLGITYLLIQDIVALVVIALMAITILVYVNRKPRVIKYSMNRNALSVDEKVIELGAFRSFSAEDTPHGHAIFFEPLQRFMPPITIYFDNDTAEFPEAVDMLARSLPSKRRELDIVDQLVHRLRL